MATGTEHRTRRVSFVNAARFAIKCSHLTLSSRRGTEYDGATCSRQKAAHSRTLQRLSYRIAWRRSYTAIPEQKSPCGNSADRERGLGGGRPAGQAAWPPAVPETPHAEAKPWRSSGSSGACPTRSHPRLRSCRSFGRQHRGRIPGAGDPAIAAAAAPFLLRAE